MKKYRTTKKDVRTNYDVSISVPYCALQTMLRVCDPSAFYAGVYGWGADVYEDWYDGQSVAIVTGYDPIGTVKPSFDDLRKFEHASRLAVERFPYDKAEDVLRRLYCAFIERYAQRQKTA